MSGLVCMFCGRPPEDPPLGSDAFVFSGDGMYHEGCENLYYAQRALGAERRVQNLIIDATIAWVLDHHHYGDIPEISDADRAEIISDAYRRGLARGAST